MSINLRFGLADDGENSWEFRQVSLAPLFEAYHADFIGMQEANGFQVDFIQGLLGRYGYIGRKDTAPEDWQDNIIFFKKTWECIHQDHFYLSDTPDVLSKFEESRWPRQCVIGMFKKGNHSLICVNTHFDFKESVQIQSAGVIKNRLSMFPSDVPVLLMGDFNAEPADACYRELVPETSEEGGFRDAFSTEDIYTHHGFTGSRINGRIDWMLYRGDIHSKESKVVKDKFAGYFPSDHYPIYATFLFTA